MKYAFMFVACCCLSKPTLQQMAKEIQAKIQPAIQQPKIDLKLK